MREIPGSRRPDESSGLLSHCCRRRSSDCRTLRFGQIYGIDGHRLHGLHSRDCENRRRCLPGLATGAIRDLGRFANVSAAADMNDRPSLEAMTFSEKSFRRLS